MGRPKVSRTRVKQPGSRGVWSRILEVCTVVNSLIKLLTIIATVIIPSSLSVSHEPRVSRSPSRVIPLYSENNKDIIFRTAPKEFLDTLEEPLHSLNFDVMALALKAREDSPLSGTCANLIAEVIKKEHDFVTKQINSKLFTSRADCLIIEGKFSEAIKDLEQALEFDQDNFHALLLLKTSYEEILGNLIKNRPDGRESPEERLNRIRETHTKIDAIKANINRLQSQNVIFPRFWIAPLTSSKLEDKPESLVVLVDASYSFSYTGRDNGRSLVSILKSLAPATHREAANNEYEYDARDRIVIFGNNTDTSTSFPYVSRILGSTIVPDKTTDMSPGWYMDDILVTFGDELYRGDTFSKAFGRGLDGWSSSGRDWQLGTPYLRECAPESSNCKNTVSNENHKNTVVYSPSSNYFGPDDFSYGRATFGGDGATFDTGLDTELMDPLEGRPSTVINILGNDYGEDSEVGNIRIISSPGNHNHDNSLDDLTLLSGWNKKTRFIKEGLENQKHLNLTESVQSQALSTSRLLAIGINSSNSKLDMHPLEFAVSDAKKVAEAFARSNFDTTLLINERANNANILSALLYESLISKPEDTFVLYIAGHGFSDSHGNRFILTHSDDKDRGEILSLAETKAALSTHKGRVFVIVDTCFNKYNVDLKGHLSLNVKQIGKNSPTFLFAGSVGEKAIESRTLGSGLATYALLEFLADLPNSSNEELNFKEMFGYVLKRTPAMALSRYGLSQNPVIVPAEIADLSSFAYTKSQFRK